MKRSTNSRAAVITVFIPVVILLAVICIFIIYRSIELPTEGSALRRDAGNDAKLLTPHS